MQLLVSLLASPSRGWVLYRVLCTQELSILVEIPGRNSIHAVLCAGEGMAILLVVLAFLVVTALGLATALALVKTLRQGHKHIGTSNEL
jgi:hypothetical protein